MITSTFSSSTRVMPLSSARSLRARGDSMALVHRPPAPVVRASNEGSASHSDGGRNSLSSRIGRPPIARTRESQPMPPLTSIDDLLEQLVAHGGSDLHISVDSPPAIRVRGQIHRLEGYEPLSADDARLLLYRILSSEQQKHFEIKRQLDFAY